MRKNPKKTDTIYYWMMICMCVQWLKLKIETNVLISA